MMGSDSVCNITWRRRQQQRIGTFHSFIFFIFFSYCAVLVYLVKSESPHVSYQWPWMDISETLCMYVMDVEKKTECNLVYHGTASKKRLLIIWTEPPCFFFASLLSFFSPFYFKIAQGKSFFKHSNLAVQRGFGRNTTIKKLWRAYHLV